MLTKYQTFLKKNHAKLCALFNDAHFFFSGSEHSHDMVILVRDMQELLAEKIKVDHQAQCRWIYQACGILADQHRAAHKCSSAGASACQLLKRFNSMRATMARLTVIH